MLTRFTQEVRKILKEVSLNQTERELIVSLQNVASEKSINEVVDEFNPKDPMSRNTRADLYIDVCSAIKTAAEKLGKNHTHLIDALNSVAAILKRIIDILKSKDGNVNDYMDICRNFNNESLVGMLFIGVYTPPLKLGQNPVPLSDYKNLLERLKSDFDVKEKKKPTGPLSAFVQEEYSPATSESDKRESNQQLTPASSTESSKGLKMKFANSVIEFHEDYIANSTNSTNSQTHSAPASIDMSKTSNAKSSSGLLLFAKDGVAPASQQPVTNNSEQFLPKVNATVYKV